MYILGLTGGIASGKSTVSGILLSLGAYIIDADRIAREIVEPGETAWQEIVESFGRDILLPDHHINRDLLGQMVFENKNFREKLEHITHSRIKERVVLEIEDARRKQYQVAVLDVPLLLEAGWQTMTNAVWVVYVNKSTQLARLMKRNSLSFEQADARLKAQMDLEEKRFYADVVIDNNGDLACTKKQVLAAWQKIKETCRGNFLVE